MTKRINNYGKALGKGEVKILEPLFFPELVPLEKGLGILTGLDEARISAAADNRALMALAVAHRNCVNVGIVRAGTLVYVAVDICRHLSDGLKGQVAFPGFLAPNPVEDNLDSKGVVGRVPIPTHLDDIACLEEALVLVRFPADTQRLKDPADLDITDLAG